MITERQRRVVVVGGTRGLGAALASEYRARGNRVDVVGRTAGAGVRVCDLSEPAAVASLASDASFVEQIDLCLFVAGASEAGYLDDLDAASFRRCLEVNALAPMTLFYALARSRVPCRRFVFVLSGVVEVDVPGMAPYAVAKRALADFLAFRQLDESFRETRIMAVYPGPIATDFDASTRLFGNFSLPRNRRARSAAEVARRIVEAERAGKTRLTLSHLPTLVGGVQRLAPRVARQAFRLLGARRR